MRRLKLKKICFYIESPFQLLCAYEAIHHFDHDEVTIVIRVASAANDKQINFVLNQLFQNKNIHCHKIKISSPLTVLDFLRAIGMAIAIFTQRSYVHKMYIGDFRSMLVRYLLIPQFKRDRIRLLDDGVATLLIQKQFSDRKNYDLFTFFDLIPFKNQKIVKHLFDVSRKQLARADVISTNHIFIVGTNLDTHFKNPESFFSILHEVLPDDSENESVYYFPHRKESKKKIKKIQEAYPKWTIKDISYPIEYYRLMEGQCPKKIISFCSTGLYLISILNPNIPINLISVNECFIKEVEMKDHSQLCTLEIYAFLKQLNVKTKLITTTDIHLK